MKPRDRWPLMPLILVASLLASSCGPWHSRQTFTETRAGRPGWIEKSRIARSKKPKADVTVAAPRPIPAPRIDVPIMEPE